ncbi:uncharacterized protein LOC119092394 [Pollicipes pollicipes]|uniref:uncharacterized protein LOC119092394 n=1 Tax=Pollicipes pollicipes TaxID=41117 RepID=UPI001885487D|nr:uncharacterized protein LOC119092394 [Pollicipes pollicipes]
MRPRTAAAGALAYPPPVLLVLALVLVGADRGAALSCLQEGDAGTTYPRREINLKPGETFNITCQIDLQHPKVIGYSSADLYFTRVEERAGRVAKTEVPADQYTVVNSSSVLLTGQLSEAVRHTYTCRLRRSDVPTTGICMTSVNVGCECRLGPGPWALWGAFSTPNGRLGAVARRLCCRRFKDRTGASWERVVASLIATSSPWAVALLFKTPPNPGRNSVAPNGHSSRNAIHIQSIISSCSATMAPLAVENFRCVSHNWVNISCSWNESFNAVRTKYQSSVCAVGGAGEWGVADRSLPAGALRTDRGGVDRVGATYPRREINLKPGETFNITCQIDLQHPKVIGYSSADLYFTRVEERAGRVAKTEVPADQYTVVNSSSVLLTGQLSEAVRHTYTCRLRRSDVPTTGICMTSVNVGYAPLAVENFRCVSHNWVNISCSWNESFNAVRTKYQVLYRLASFPHYVKACSEDLGARVEPTPGRGGSARCTVGPREFRKTHERILMEVNASNALGTRVRSFPLDTYAIVLPAPPASTWVADVTSHALQLWTNVSHPMNTFPKRLLFDVQYTSSWDERLQVVDASPMQFQPSPNNSKRSVAVTGLSPYTEYELRVRVRSSLAVGEDMWSEPAAVTVRTRPTVPSEAPQVDAASFQLVGTADSRDVYVYWRQIATRHQNGANFTYCVSALTASGARSGPAPDLVTAAYAGFRRVGLGRLRFRVAACNAEGESEEAAELTVPARNETEVVPRPHAVILHVSERGEFELSWEQHADVPVDNYTVFWCEHIRHRSSFQCEGQLNWRQVPGDTRSFALDLPRPAEYQFAVAATRQLPWGVTSSGMVWSQCTVLDSGGLIMLSDVRVEYREARQLTLAWNGECSYSAKATGYVVYYCSALDGECDGDDRRLLVGDVNSSSVRVTGLQPFTEYRLQVAVVSADDEGQRSSALLGRTLMARPDQPPNVTEVAPLSNTSLRVSWTPPARPNGRMSHFVLRFKRDRMPYHELRVDATRNSWTLDGLLPYTRYNVSLVACNEAWSRLGCSPRSWTAGRTLPGVPGVMEPPRTQLLNVSTARVRWQPPLRPGGPQPVYTLRVLSERDGHNSSTERPLPAGRLLADLPVPDCEPGSAQRHLFSVRASVQLASGERLVGPWSEQTQQNCVLTSDWPTGTIVFVVVGGAVLMMAVISVFFFVCSRTKRKLTEMRNLGVNLPPGLDQRLEKPPLHAFPGQERRPVPAAGGGGGYGRLVSQNSAGTDHTTASVSGQPLLQDDLGREECDGEGSELTPAVNTDSNSCSSSATNYTDSGAECEKASSPTYNRFQWPAPEQPKLAAYVQIGGPEPSGAAAAAAAAPPPPYTKFSPYVDAKAIQSLMARSMETLSEGEPAHDLSRSEPDLSAAGGGPAEPYSKIGHRSSTGYVSMTSDDALAPAGRLGSPPTRGKLRPPAKAELKPYVTLGPPPPPVASAGYVAHDKIVPAQLELRDLPASTVTSGYVSQEALSAAEPVLSPKKLPTVATARDPYRRVVTSHQSPPDLGPNVSMV